MLGTIASPGACVEGELALQASILGELQRGCDATARIATADGGEQSVEVPSVQNVLVAPYRHRTVHMCVLVLLLICAEGLLVTCLSQIVLRRQASRGITSKERPFLVRHPNNLFGFRPDLRSRRAPAVGVRQSSARKGSWLQASQQLHEAPLPVLQGETSRWALDVRRPWRPQVQGKA